MNERQFMSLRLLWTMEAKRERDPKVKKKAKVARTEEE